jgi:hypothetical protein
MTNSSGAMDSGASVLTVPGWRGVERQGQLGQLGLSPGQFHTCARGKKWGNARPNCPGVPAGVHPHGPSLGMHTPWASPLPSSEEQG